MNTEHGIQRAAALAALLALGCAGRTAAAPTNSLFNPADYLVLSNSYTLASGSLAIDTKNGTNAPTWNDGVNPPLYGQVVTNQSGSNVLALFCFGNLAISNGVSCTVSGNLGLVIACSNNLTLANTLDLSGGLGGVTNGGPGGEAGVLASSFQSAPPDGNHGKGGVNRNGYGYGAGRKAADNTCGSGGGFGGGGGWALWSSVTTPGGTNYGDSVLTCLFGGSGGGGTDNGTMTGGGGGGALELIANGTLTITATATQKVNGAAGYNTSSRAPGGGSGGGMILAANSLVVAGTLQAKGGDGANCTSKGGGGGGGRIVLYANALTTNGMSWSVAGGLKGAAGNAADGAAGTFRCAYDGRTDDPLGGNLIYPFVSATLPPQIASPSVTNVTASSATLRAHLTSDGGASTTVSVFWGTTNGGASAAAWANTRSFAPGQWSNGSDPLTNLTGLSADQSYYAAFCAANSAGSNWTAAANFITGRLELQALDATCGVSTADAAVVQVSRPATCTNETLTVFYTTGGSATNGADFLASPASGTLVISNGMTNALITLTPLAPWNDGTPRTFTVTLLPGLYVTGTANTATCTLGHYTSYLSYNPTAFVERWQNDGRIGNAITVTMPTNSAGKSLDLFSGSNGSDFIAAGKVQVSGVPAGLTAAAARTATNTVQLSLAGAANNHLASASVSNLTVTFLDSAFAGNSAAIVANAVQSNVAVTFVSDYYPSNFYVATTGSDSTGDGTVTNPVATLAKALTLARSDANDTIHLLPGTYTESNLMINAIVTITGNTRDDTILQAWPTPFNAVNTNLFLLNYSYNWIRAGAVRNLTLQHAIGPVSGAAISLGNNGSYNCYYRFDSCRFARNAANKVGQFQGGGAINTECPVPGGVEIVNCEFIENRTVCDGGAVRSYAAGPSISNCVFVGNQSGRIGGAVSGGFNVLFANNSFFAGNAATNGGGAIAVELLYATNCTFATNSAARGGAVSCSLATLVQCTVSSNTAAWGGGLDASSAFLYNSTVFQNSASLTGGGVRCSNQYSSWSSIVAGNAAPAAPDVIAISLGTVANSLVGNNTNSGLTAAAPDANTNYIGTAAAPVASGLLPLARNGGLLPTCALQAGSVAIDHGSNPLGLAWDARGPGYTRAFAPRPQTAVADMGAYEYGATPPTPGTSVFFR
jgi:hypothetical protein